MTKHFTNANFQTEVIEASKNKPVLVDFFASWCGPCQMQAPIIEELSEELKDQAIIGKLDTEESRQIAANYNVMSIPTLIIFKDGKPAKTMIGLQWKEQLIEEIKKLA